MSILQTNIPAPLSHGRDNSEVLVLSLLSEFPRKIKFQLPIALAYLKMYLMLVFFPSLSHFLSRVFLDLHSYKLFAFKYLSQVCFQGN